MSENENGNQNGQGDQIAADGAWSRAGASAQQDGNVGEKRGDAQAEVRADPSGGQGSAEENAAVSAAEADPTCEEFEAYVDGELNAMAQRLGYRKIYLERIPQADLFPAWFYPKGSSDGKVCNDASEVPEGWVRRPFE